MELIPISSMNLKDIHGNLVVALTVYPYKTRSWRLNLQLMHVYKSSAGGTFGLYTAGQTGTTFTFGTDILLVSNLH